jgi:hypothetical protein
MFCRARLLRRAANFRLCPTFPVRLSIVIPTGATASFAVAQWRDPGTEPPTFTLTLLYSYPLILLYSFISSSALLRELCVSALISSCRSLCPLCSDLCDLCVTVPLLFAS